MKYLIYLGAIVCLLVMALAGTAQSTGKSTMINFMVDMDLPSSPTADQIHQTQSNFITIINLFSTEPRKLNWTIFLVQDASLNERLFLAQLGLDNSMELAISGNHSNEQLSTADYGEQKKILDRSMEIVKATKVCGTNVIEVWGFKPQSFDQNEDTYKALDDIGIKYNVGFQAGLIYAPGHESDVWPYKVPDHKFYAVPVSTYSLSGEKIPLDDRYAKDNELSSSQWYDLLTGKLDEASVNGEPVIISLSTSVSGKGDYLDALTKFINYAESKDAKFVKTIDLVNMTIRGSDEVLEESIEVCEECQSAADITVTNDSILVG